MFKARLLLLLPLLSPAPALAVPVASHDYEFAGTLADANGGSALTRLAGGTLGTAANPGFTFGANDGLLLSGVSASAPYSLEMLFDFDSIDRYFKIIDFQNRGNDNGLYSGRGNLDLYPRATSSGAAFQPGVLTELLFTRSAVGMVKAYVNGVQSIAYDDSTTGITASGTNALVLLADDSTTSYREAFSGFLRRIRLFDSVLTPADAMDLAFPPAAADPVASVSVPEPGAASVLFAGLAALLAARFRRRGAVARPA